MGNLPEGFADDVADLEISRDGNRVTVICPSDAVADQFERGLRLSVQAIVLMAAMDDVGSEDG